MTTAGYNIDSFTHSGMNYRIVSDEREMQKLASLPPEDTPRKWTDFQSVISFFFRSFVFWRRILTEASPQSYPKP